MPGTFVLQQDTLSSLLLSTQVYKWVPGRMRMLFVAWCGMCAPLKWHLARMLPRELSRYTISAGLILNPVTGVIIYCKALWVVSHTRKALYKNQLLYYCLFDCSPNPWYTVVSTTYPRIDVGRLSTEIEHFKNRENTPAKPQTKGSPDVTCYKTRIKEWEKHGKRKCLQLLIISIKYSRWGHAITHFITGLKWWLIVHVPMQRQMNTI